MANNLQTPNGPADGDGWDRAAYHVDRAKQAWSMWIASPLEAAHATFWGVVAAILVAWLAAYAANVYISSDALQHGIPSIIWLGGSFAMYYFATKPPVIGLVGILGFGQGFLANSATTPADKTQAALQFINGLLRGTLVVQFVWLLAFGPLMVLSFERTPSTYWMFILAGLLLWLAVMVAGGVLRSLITILVVLAYSAGGWNLLVEYANPTIFDPHSGKPIYMMIPPDGPIQYNRKVADCYDANGQVRCYDNGRALVPATQAASERESLGRPQFIRWFNAWRTSQAATSSNGGSTTARQTVNIGVVTQQTSILMEPGVTYRVKAAPCFRLIGPQLGDLQMDPEYKNGQFTGWTGMSHTEAQARSFTMTPDRVAPGSITGC